MEMGFPVMTNSQMGVSFYVDTTKMTSSSWGVGSKTTMESNKKRNWRVFVLRKEDSEKKIVLKKELEFKPSFTEYLKALDSVKAERDTQAQNVKMRESSDKRSVISKSRDGSKDELNENVELSRFDERGSLVGKSRDAKVKRVSRGETSNSRFLVSRRDSGVKNASVNKGPTFGNASRDKPFRRSEYIDSVDTRGKFLHDRSSSKRVGSEREKSDIRGWDRGGYNGATPERNRIGTRMNGADEDGSEFKSSSNRSFRAKTGGEKSWEVERAAFRTLEEDNDIMDKPRVPKVEMEERIQHLARRLNGADINVPEWMFSKTIRSARIRFSDHSILRVIQILGKLGNWRRVLQMIEWLERRERYKSHRLRNIYTTALSVLGKARRPVEALNVFCAMQQQMSTYPDLVAYHCIAVTLGQAGHIKELFDVIDSMRSPPKKKFKTGLLEKWDPRLEPDVVIYNAVLNACVQRKQCEGAFWVLQQLRQQGQKPSATTYGLVMEVMFACGKYNLVHEFFRKVQKSFIPNALAYKVLVNTFWKEGKTDEAVSAVQDMERRGIVGSAALYYDLARCLCSAGRCQEALAQMEKICRVANRPLVVTYTGLIQACLDSGNIQDAVDIFSQMKNFCSPNLVTCNIMIKAYLEHGWFEEAKKLLEKMSEASSYMSDRSDNKDVVIPDIYTFNTMLEACTDEKRWDDVVFVYRKMLHHGYHFNAKRHLRIILDASRAGKVELLETTLNHLAETDRRPPLPLIQEMFCFRLENKDYGSALSCVTGLPVGDWPEFSEDAWLNLLERNSWRFGEDTLVQLLHEASIHAKKESPNPVLLNLISSCKVFLRTQIVPARHLRNTLSTVLAESLK